MSTINLADLTAEQIAELASKLKEKRQSEKEKRAANLKALEELAAETLPKAFQNLKEASEVMAQAKANVFNHFSDYLKLKISTIGIKSNQQSHTITYGNQKLILGYRVSDGYTDEANYGIAMVHKYIQERATDENSKMLVKSLLRLLQKNGKGDLDSKKVLELRQIANDYPDSDLDKGVEIIQSSYKPKMSKWFIEAYETDSKGIEKSIPLSITGANLPEDFDLSFLLPSEENKEE